MAKLITHTINVADIRNFMPVALIASDSNARKSLEVETKLVTPSGPEVWFTVTQKGETKLVTMSLSNAIEQYNLLVK